MAEVGPFGTAKQRPVAHARLPVGILTSVARRTGEEVEPGGGATTAKERRETTTGNGRTEGWASKGGRYLLTGSP
jgi:hypothetical protein